MRSQLPEHTLVTLLRQCFVTPRCQVLRQSATRSSKLFHTSPSYEGRTLSATGAQHRRIHTRDGPPDDLRTQFTSIEPSYPLDNVLRAQSKAPKAIQHQKLTPEQNIAVIGAGITGLATAYFLTKEMNNATVTIYETFKEGGGWIKSLEYPGEDGDVIFELGPRNLRPNTPAALVTIKMVCSHWRY
jgi:oxygen-dependent protoporphyrinogen oxidase